MPIAFEQNVQTKQLALCSKGNQICKFFKNKIGSLRAHNFPDIGIKKKKSQPLDKNHVTRVRDHGGNTLFY